MPLRSQPGARIALGIGLLAYGTILFVLIGAVAGGSDNSGYFNEARLLSQGTLHVPMRTLKALPSSQTPFLYAPLGFKPAVDRPDTLVPTYPPGFPLMLVPAAWIVGWPHAGDVLLIIHSLLGLWLVFALGRACGLPDSWSLGGALLIAASPLYLYISLQALSDIPATVWAVAAVLAALKSREKSAWAFASGLCVAVAFLVRPNNFLIAVPILIAIGVSPRRLLLLAGGALPGLLAWMAINHSAYGDPLTSGYGAIGNEFHSSLVVGTSAFYVKWLPRLLSPVVFLSPLLLTQLRRIPRVSLMLVCWAAAYLAFFSAYRWTHEQWWFLRFILPAAPALVVGGLLTAFQWMKPSAGAAGGLRFLPVLLLASLVLLQFSRSNLFREARYIGHGERKYGRVAQWLNTHAPKDSVLITSQASGALFYFTPFTLLRYEDLRPELLSRAKNEARREGRTVYAVLFPFEIGELKNLPGNWHPASKVDDVAILQLAPDSGK